MNENTKLLEQGRLSPYEKYKKSIHVLLQSPRDLWMIFTVKVLTFSGFSVLSIALSLYLTEVLDFTDIEMGIIIGFQGVLWGFYSLTLGNFPDRYGIRFSLMLGTSLKLVCMIILLLVDNRYVQVVFVTVVASAGITMSIPTTKLAVKRYTKPESRSMGFSFYYILFFGSAAIAGVVTDIILSSGDEEDMTTYRYTFLFGAIVMSIALIITFFVRELDFSNTGEEIVQVERPQTNIIQDTRSILILKSFWRFFCLALLLVFIRAIYTHITITLPLYMEREIGEGSHFGYMIALHAICTLLFTPSLTFFIYIFSNYSLFLIGGLVCIVSPLFLLFPGNYLTVSLFVTLSSVGEAIHSPRLLDYITGIAPPSRLGIFLSVAVIPLSLSVFTAGIMGGVLLDTYCPEEGERECWKVWAIICACAAAPLILMFIARKWIEEPSYESEPYVSCSREAQSDNINKLSE